MGAVGICPVASHVFPLAKTVPTAQTYEGGPPRGGIFPLSADRFQMSKAGHEGPAFRRPRRRTSPVPTCPSAVSPAHGFTRKPGNED